MPAKHAMISLILAALWLGGCGREAEPPPAPDTRADAADLVLRGGVIATVDPAIGTVQALAVRGHTIIAVGSDESVSRHIGPQTRVIELDGRFAMPGFIEGHGHFMGLGESRQILDLGGARNWQEIVDQVAAAADKAAPGEWIFGRGWHQEKWDSVPKDAVDGVPRNDDLSAVTPDNPVLLEHASGHASFANDAALAAAFIDRDTPDPPGGTIVRAPDGEPTGLLRETAARLLNDAIAEYEGRMSLAERRELARERVRLAGEEALRNGVTSFQDAGVSFEVIDLYKELEAEGELPVRLYAMVRASNDAMAELLPHYRTVAEGNDFLTVRAIKRQVDGALGSHGAWLLEPYTDMPGSTGLVLEPLPEIERTAELAIEHGFQVNTHAIGTRANREILDLYERVWERAGVDGRKLRWRIEHAQHLHAGDVPRFAELGVIASMQGVHATSDGPWIPERLGAERGGETSYVWRDLLDAGATITNGTDVPVERIDPIASFHASVTRRTASGERFHPEQSMTREEALASYTIHNAFAAFEEDIKGSLTPGKLADIVVLSQDLLSVPDERIPETEVLMTIVGGEIRYERDGPGR